MITNNYKLSLKKSIMESYELDAETRHHNNLMDITFFKKIPFALVCVGYSIDVVGLLVANQLISSCHLKKWKPQKSYFSDENIF